MALIVNVEMIDGTRHAAPVILADQVAYETTARTRGWGAIEASPITFAAFTAWKSLTRTGNYSGTFEQFQMDVSSIADTEGEDDGLDPTEGVQHA